MSARGTGAAGPWPKATVRGEAKQLLVHDHLSVHEAEMRCDDSLHLIEEELLRDAAEPGEGLLESPEERPQVLPLVDRSQSRRE